MVSLPTLAQNTRQLTGLAIITSHNIIIVHCQLIRFPDIAFFTSPIPLHIAAMVILYGHMSKCDSLPRNTALEDLWMALDMLPRFRWRWERKDVNGGHPLIAGLAERVMNVNLHQIHPVISPMLLCETEWDDDASMSPPPNSQTTPTPSTATWSGSANSNSGSGEHYNQPHASSPKVIDGRGSRDGTPPDKQLMDVPTTLFYPFFPESFPGQSAQPATSSGNGNGGHQDYTQILAVAAQQEGAYGCQPSEDHYMSEEREAPPAANIQVWMNVVSPTSLSVTR